MKRLLSKLYRIVVAVIILIAGRERTVLIELLSDPYNIRL
ncbi:hypothetical protein THIOSC15_2510003 [uncultured Thiomicrorhabdus sp.]